jgi:hypothetical protein
LQHVADPPPTRTWSFPAPFGALEVVAFPLTEIITISRHLPTPEVHAYMNLAPLSDLHDPDTPTPTAPDESGRSDQLFLMDVIVRRGREERRATARGRDIYAVSAPIVVEAATRILDGRIERSGVATAGELFDAHNFLGPSPTSTSWSTSPEPDVELPPDPSSLPRAPAPPTPPNATRALVTGSP